MPLCGIVVEDTCGGGERCHLEKRYADGFFDVVLVVTDKEYTDYRCCDDHYR